MIKGSIILMVAFCVTTLLWRRSAAERHIVWAAAIASAGLVPFMSLLLPSWQPDLVRKVASVLPAISRTNLFGTAPYTVDVIMHAETIEAPVLTISHIVLLVWAIGTGVGVFILFAGTAMLVRTVLRAEPVSDPSLKKIAIDLAHAYRLERPIQLLLSSENSMPVTWGTLRPRVLLPSCASGWSEDRMRIVLAHELAHIHRHDWLFQIIADLLRAVYWFNPLFWMAHSRLHWESEHACDDAVVRLGADRRDYATHLFEIARTLKKRAGVWRPALAVARQSNLERRFAALLNSTTNRAALTRRSALRIMTAAFVLVLPLSAVSMPESRASGDEFLTTFPQVSMANRRTTLDAGVTPATIVDSSTPALYSDEARRLGIEGIVRLEVHIDVDGNVAGARIVEGLGFGLDQNALLAVRHWQFTPGTRDGRPTEMTTLIDVEFSLRNEELNELIANDMATRVGPGVSPPRLIHRVDVRYPQSARDMKVMGTVVLDVVIRQDGAPKVVRIVQSLEPELDDSAVRALEQWKFSAAMKNGTPVKVRMNAEVKFQMN
jgi:TonB family protein